MRGRDRDGGRLFPEPRGERERYPTRGCDDDCLPRLGRLAVEGYQYEPSASQLAAMMQEDPESLKKVGGGQLAAMAQAHKEAAVVRMLQLICGCSYVGFRVSLIWSTGHRP